MTIEQLLAIINGLAMTEAELQFSFTLLKALSSSGRPVMDVVGDIQYLFGFAGIRRLELAVEVAQSSQSQAYADAETQINELRIQISALREQMKLM
jgi:hypothetical protein